MASLLLINVFGQGVLNLLSRFGFAPQLWPGFSPGEISKLILDSQFFERLREARMALLTGELRSIDDGLAWRTIFSMVSLAGLLPHWQRFSFGTLSDRFEIVAGRARRSTSPPPLPPKPFPSTRSNARRQRDRDERM